MWIAQNDNGPNPCASVAIQGTGPGMSMLVLKREPGVYGLLRLRHLPGLGFVRDAPLLCPHPFPQAFGCHETYVPAPAPARSTTRKRRPAFIRGVVEREAV